MSDENKITRPTPERMAMAGDNAVFEIHELKHGEQTRVLRMVDSPLDRLAFGAKPKITGEQYHAGLRLYADAYGAGLMPAGVIDPAKERVDGGQFKNISDARIAAQVRFEHTIKRLSRDHYHVLESVVIQEESLSDYSKRFSRFSERRERIAVAVDRICSALDALARIYNPPRRDIGITNIHTDDYRPSIPQQDKPA